MLVAAVFALTFSPHQAFALTISNVYVQSTNASSTLAIPTNTVGLYFTTD